MTHNPAPRPALRKAPDATIHPAAPVVADPEPTAAIAPGVPVPAARVVAAPAHLRPVVALGGATSDSLRSARGSGDRSRTTAGTASADSSSGKKAKAARRRAAKDAARHARRVDLHIKVPKDVRRQLRKNAKARGTSVDDVVTAVLEGWLER